MQLLQVATLFLLLSSFCSSKGKADVVDPVSRISTIKTSVTILNTASPPTSAIKPTTEISPKETTNNESSETSPVTTATSLTTIKSEETTSLGITNNSSELITTKATMTNLSLPNAVSTLQSSQQKTENQSSIKETEKSSVTTQQPDTSPTKTTMLTSTSITPPKIISSIPDTEDGKNASASSTSPSYSSIILPVVIALIVITLSVFVLVGLYRMCWKIDPGTPENGNDQPQSDKESVKLLTVKTISHESGNPALLEEEGCIYSVSLSSPPSGHHGELSAAGKNKN